MGVDFIMFLDAGSRVHDVGQRRQRSPRVTSTSMEIHRVLKIVLHSLMRKVKSRLRK